MTDDDTPTDESIERRFRILSTLIGGGRLPFPSVITRTLPEGGFRLPPVRRLDDTR